MHGSDTLHQSYRRGIPVVTPVRLQPQSEENPTECRSNFSDETARRAFIRKVYMVLMVQLVVTFGFLYFCTFHFDVKKFMLSNWKLSSCMFLIAVILVAVVATAMTCCENARRKFPLNYILLTLLTVALALLFGMMTAVVPPKIMMFAVGVTSAVCLVLTLFAFQSKIDFTTCSGTIAAFTSSVLFFGLIAAVTKSNYLHLVFSIAFVLLASWYFVYDTQLIVGGKHKFAFYPDDYVFATLCLYTDIIGILAILLDILSANERRGRN